jgi:solute:Na+ symporter, SSS family
MTLAICAVPDGALSRRVSSMNGSGVELRMLDVLAIILYAIAMLALGWWATKRVKTTEGYFVGGRSVPGWAVGLSLLGTAISSITFLAYPGSAYGGNWTRLVPGMMLPVAALVGAYFFVVFYRRTLFVSAFQYYEKRFGTWGRTYASIAWNMMSVYRMGTILYLVSLPIQYLSGWNIVMVMLVTGTIITIYTMMGGLEAVIWTDVVQTLVLAVGGLITVIIVFAKIGFAEVFSIASAANKFDMVVDTDFTFVRDTFWVLMIGGIIGNVQEHATDQTMIQRYAAAKTDRGAIIAVWIVGLGCIPLWSLFMFVGTCLWVYYGAVPDVAVQAGMAADAVYPHFIITQMPPFVGGLVISAVLAAAMSSIDSSMNATATAFTADFYRRHWVRGRTDAHYLFAARCTTVLLGLLMVLVALALYSLGRDSILDTLFFIGSVMGAGLGGFFLLGFWSNRVNTPGAGIGLAAGVLSIAWCTVSANIRDAIASAEAGASTVSDWYYVVQPYLVDIHPFFIGVVGNVVVFAVGLSASFAFSAPLRDRIAGMTWWTRSEVRADAGQDG